MKKLEFINENDSIDQMKTRIARNNEALGMQILSYQSLLDEVGQHGMDSELMKMVCNLTGLNGRDLILEAKKGLVRCRTMIRKCKKFSEEIEAESEKK